MIEYVVIALFFGASIAAGWLAGAWAERVFHQRHMRFWAWLTQPRRKFYCSRCGHIAYRRWRRDTIPPNDWHEVPSSQWDDDGYRCGRWQRCAWQEAS